MKITALILSFILYPFAFSLAADDLPALRMELVAVQRSLEAERQRYNAAKAEMERAELVARYLFPELQAREQAVAKKIAEAEKKAADEKK